MKTIKGVGLALEDAGIQEMMKRSPQERVELYRAILDKHGLDDATKEDTLRGMVMCAVAAKHIQEQGYTSTGEFMEETPEEKEKNKWDTTEVDPATGEKKLLN